VALRDQITNILDNASFDGTNLVDGSTNQISALANAAGDKFVTASAQDLSLSGTIVSLASTATISTSTKASSAISTIESSLDKLGLALSNLGTDSKKLGIHKTFISKLADELKNGIGNLVDADLATESAKLQALQTKQQLGIQALSIANQAPSTLLALFR
jgi:flagellin